MPTTRALDEELAFTHAKVQRLAYDVDLQYNAHYETAREERLKTVVGPCIAAGVFAVERLGALLRGRASWVPSRFTAATAIAAAAYNFYKFKEEHVEQQRRAGKALEKVYDIAVVPLVDELYGRAEHSREELRAIQAGVQRAREAYHHELEAAFPGKTAPQTSNTAWQLARFKVSKPLENRVDSSQEWKSWVDVSGGVKWQELKRSWAPEAMPADKQRADSIARAWATLNPFELLNWKDRNAYVYHWVAFEEARRSWMAVAGGLLQ